MAILEYAYNFFNAPIIVIIGGISTLIMLSASVYTAYLIIKGVVPVWYRLGKGLSKRKIAIFALSPQDNELRNLLIDSKIFLKDNIINVTDKELKKASEHTLLLVHYKPFKDCLDRIISNKKDEAALIVYAPRSEGDIDDETMMKINTERNSIIVNMRGRLINDILTCMITTGYEKK